jgi:hypothetical protein
LGFDTSIHSRFIRVTIYSARLSVPIGADRTTWRQRDSRRPAVGVARGLVGNSRADRCPVSISRADRSLWRQRGSWRPAVGADRGPVGSSWADWSLVGSSRADRSPVGSSWADRTTWRQRGSRRPAVGADWGPIGFWRADSPGCYISKFYIGTNQSTSLFASCKISCKLNEVPWKFWP